MREQRSLAVVGGNAACSCIYVDIAHACASEQLQIHVMCDITAWQNLTSSDPSEKKKHTIVI
jgi:hypothetical protein